jgi:hypothetical protein
LDAQRPFPSIMIAMCFGMFILNENYTYRVIIGHITNFEM